jgi:hypothetical protein
MKYLARIFFILTVAVAPFVFIACPVSSHYPLGEKNTEKIDPKLLGVWVNDSTEAEATRVTIKKLDDYTYNLTVDEQGESFLSGYTTFHGWLTTVGGKRFLVLEARDGGAGTAEFYTYYVEVKGNEMRSHDITLKVGGTDAIKSIETYREEVAASMKMDDFLSGEIVWRKK